MNAELFQPEEIEAQAELRDSKRRLEIQNMRLWEQIRDANADAANWREMYHQAVRYIGIFHPYLAEVVEEDAFKLWELEVR